MKKINFNAVLGVAGTVLAVVGSVVSLIAAAKSSRDGITADYGNEIDDNEMSVDTSYGQHKRVTLNIPSGCRACGGPYPQCKISCKLFDD